MIIVLTAIVIAWYTIVRSQELTAYYYIEDDEMMKAYTICNEYVELITDNGLVRCEIRGNGRNKYIEVEGKAFLVKNLY